MAHDTSYFPRLSKRAIVAARMKWKIASCSKYGSPAAITAFASAGPP